MSDATPRPWEIRDDGPDEAYAHIISCGPAIITCSVKNGPDKEDLANANLIVKAVNNHERLLEALREIVKHCKDYEYKHQPGKFEDDYGYLHDTAQAAIEAAEGGES